MRCYDRLMDRRKAASVLLLAISLGACQTVPPAEPRYVVTETPLKLLGAGHPGLCFAVDPSDRRGIWWWDPGPSGCGTQINTAVMRAHFPQVTKAASGAVELTFQMALMSGPRDTRLVLEDGVLREAASGQQVPTARRDDLNIPFAFGR